MADSIEPRDRSSPFGDGRDPATGRFVKSWKGGPGNPHGGQIARLRSSLLDAVTPERMAQLIEKMIQEGCEGNVAAARLVLEYTLGRTQPMAGPAEGDGDGLVVYIVPHDGAP